MYLTYMGVEFPLSQRYTNKLTRKPLVDQWGFEFNRTWWGGGRSNGNPDETTIQEKWDHSNQPICIAGKISRNIGYLWVTASGLTKAANGVDYPPQLVYYNPEYSDQEIYDTIAYQLDEAFDVRFGQIIKKIEDDAKDNGRAIAEIQWFVKESEPFPGKLFASFIHSRDPEPYKFDPKDYPPGLYKDEGYGELILKDQNKFMVFTYDGEFDNPYGRSINYPLRPWLDTWPKIFGYWRAALEKAGLGAWVALYDENVMGGDDTPSQQMRDLLMEQVKEIAGGTASIMGKSSELTNHKLQMEAQAFMDWMKSYNEAAGLVYQGNPTSLLNEENGTRASKEATNVRSQSNLEMDDAQRIGGDWTNQFIRRVVGLNFPPGRPKALPQIYIINPATIMPTTPADQETVEEVLEEVPGTQGVPEIEREEPPELSAPIELQEEEPDETPVAVPPSYEEFPRETDTPEAYMSVADGAKAFLNDMPSKRYETVQPAESASTFTIKRLGSLNMNPVDEEALLVDLKNAIVPTLDNGNEADAWTAYYDDAVLAFAQFGIKMDNAIRDDLRTSFRQARQNSYWGGLFAAAGQDPTVTGVEIFNLADGHDIRTEHALFNGVRVRLDDPFLIDHPLPWDFDCVCWGRLYRGTDFTDLSSMPTDLLGKSYRFYAQPGAQ